MKKESEVSEMKKLTALLFALLLFACTPGVRKSDAPKPTEIPVAVPYAVENVTDTFLWLGRSAEALGIGAEHFDWTHSIVFSGDLFGHTVTGTAFTRTDYDDPALPKYVQKIFLTDDISYKAATEAGLCALYGEPYAEGQEPYVESQGGATFWARYWNGEGVVSLRNGANHDYYTMEYFVPDEIPEEIQKRLVGLTTEELGHRTGVYFHFEPGEAEDIRIDPTEYEGLPAYLVTLTHEDVPYRVTIVKDGAARFDALLPDGETGGAELSNFRYRINPDGSAALAEKNIVGDLWLIETDGPVTRDALLAFESFLLNRWLY